MWSCLSQRYQPTAVLRVGLILRGAAFDFGDKARVSQAASSPDSLGAILIGVCATMPIIVSHAGFAYRVFGGKTIELDDV